MKKKLVFIPLILAVIALPLLAACQETPDVFDLVFNDHNPAGTGPALAQDYWAEQLEKESGGRLNISVIHGGALFAGDEVYRAVQTGACAGGHYVVDREQGFLLNLVMTLPFMGWPEQHVEEIFWTLMEEYPEFADEWEGVTIVAFMMMPPTHVHTTDKVIRTPDDIKGVKIFCAEAASAQIMDAVGATAVEMGIMDMTPSVQTGVVDGVHNHFPVLNVFGTLEMLEYHTVFGGGGINITPMFEVMNDDVLNDLPSDLRDILLNSDHYWFDKFKELDDLDQANAITFCEENNHTFTNLSDAEIAVWRDAVKSQIHDAWLAECEAEGLPGQEVYDRVFELIAAW